MISGDEVQAGTNCVLGCLCLPIVMVIVWCLTWVLCLALHGIFHIPMPSLQNITITVILVATASAAGQYLKGKV